MTYANKFAEYGIFTDGMLYKWFRSEEIARKEFAERFAKEGCREEWLEEYDEVVLRNVRTNKVLEKISVA